MAKKEFFQNVRRAVSCVAPRVDADNPYSDPRRLEHALRGATVWLTPRAVEGFDPRDFADMPARERDALAAAVEMFSGVAQTVLPKQPATREQVQASLPPFLGIVGAVQRIVRDEWVQAAGALVDQAHRWAEARVWPTRRFRKMISEDLIGTYELEKLVFAADGSQLVLNPVGRFAPGAEGMFDLAVLPVYESAMVVRQEGLWSIHPVGEQGALREWSESAFVETALMLARLA